MILTRKNTSGIILVISHCPSTPLRHILTPLHRALPLSRRPLTLLCHGEGRRVYLKGGGKALKGDKEALNVDGEVLKGDEEALDCDGEELKGDGEPLKS